MNQLYVGAVVLSLAVVLFLESVLPLHPAGAPLRRWGGNLALSALAIATTLAAPLLFWAVARLWGPQPGGGWLGRWGLPGWPSGCSRWPS